MGDLFRKIFKQQQHPFHLVDPSPWPAVVSICLYHLMCFSVYTLNETFTLQELLASNFFTSILFPTPICYFGFFMLLFITSLFYWFYNISLEATYRGQHSLNVQKMLRSGFFLFILSEAMFFFSFFWSFFHLSVSPSIFIGAVWPTYAMAEIVIDPLGLPLFNTCILLVSGFFVTTFHMQLIELPKKKRFVIFNNKRQQQSSLYVFILPNNEFKRKLIYSIFLLLTTILLGLFFTALQLFEYEHSLFNISDSVFSSLFYLTTGFHGIHVAIGTLLLAVGLWRLLLNEFTESHHVGLQSAIYYWHFVDVVWLFLYFFLYWWGI